MTYPLIDDKDFQQKISNKKEFQIKTSSNQTIEDICSNQRFKLFPHQQFVRNFLSPNTPYNNLLLWWSVGQSKTCGAIKIAEEHKNQKRKIIVLLEEGVKNNFINEIHSIDKNENQCTGTTYQKYKNTHTREEKEAIKQTQIKQYYKIQTLGKFTNEILKLYKNAHGREKIKQNYSNRLIIIDEVHNFREYDTDQPKRYDALKHMLSIANNCKLLLLSATPMFDNPREIVSIMNLFLINEQKPIVNSDVIFDKNDILTKKGGEILKQNFNGQISFVDQNSIAFPSKNFKGILFPFMTKLKLVNCPMSSYQEEQYKANINKHITTLRKNSNIIPPKNKEEFKDIKNNSSKFYKLLKKISKTSGPIFIYSEFVEHTIKLLEKVLLANGYQPYINEKSKNSFIVLDGEIDSKKRTSLLNIFNDPSNKDGKIIKIVIGSKVLKEGITLKNIQQVHILEPWYNVSRLEQVWGRGIRACSHVLLPKDKQKVDIFLYASTFKINEPFNMSDDFSEIKTRVPYDLWAYYISEQKYLKINKVENLLKQISINNLLLPTHLDLSTYDSFYVNRPLIDLTKNIITSLLKEKGFVSLEQLKKNKEIIQNHISFEIIDEASYELLTNSKTIIRRDDFLIIQPINKNEKISMFDRKNTFSRKPLPLIVDILQENNVTEKHTKPRKTLIEKPVNILRDDKIIGDYQGILMSDKTFLIKKIVETTNKRKQTRGKNCMSWKTDELEELGKIILTNDEMKQFFVNKRIKQKSKFCSLVLEKFYPTE